MNAKMPQELEVWYILPTLRAELAKNMASLGMRQKDIAGDLGITEAAVSQYIKSKRAKSIKFNAAVINRVKQAAKDISIHKKGYLAELMELCNMIRKQGLLCALHREHGYPDTNCKACMRWSK